MGLFKLLGNPKLIVAELAALAVLFPYTYGVFNYTHLGLSHGGNGNSISTRKIGEDHLQALLGESVVINYSMRDSNGLSEIKLYKNGQEIWRQDLPGRKGLAGAIDDMCSRPGDHEYKLVAVDSNGNAREDKVNVTVEDRPWNGGIQFTMTGSIFFD